MRPTKKPSESVESVSVNPVGVRAVARSALAGAALLACAGVASPAMAARIPADAIARAIGSLSSERVVGVSPDGSWRRIESVSTLSRAMPEWIRPNEYAAVRVDTQAFRASLDNAPMEFTPEAFTRPALVDIPRPEGTYEVFALVEAPVMAPELQAKYPGIRTYRGQSLDNPHNNIRVSVSHLGVRAQVVSPEGWYYVDRFSVGDSELHTSYYKKDIDNKHSDYVCRLDTTVDSVLQQAAFEQAQREEAQGRLQNGELRTYRIAVATTLQFTNFFGGDVEDGLAGVVAAVNRMTQVYENDVAVRFTVVPNNDQVIFTNSNPDPFSSFPSLSQLDSLLDSRIGSGNYDVGHLVDTGSGGFAQLGVVCSSSKGAGYTGLTPPTGDPFWIDYFSHEVGHQFAANHTFNGIRGSCSGGNRSGANAYEPGSGSTIMGYAGICQQDNVANNSGPYFHFESLAEIRFHVTSQVGANCPVVTPTGNANPTVSAGADFTIPQRTPFLLTAQGSDPDGDALTYCWEQADLGPAQALGSADNGQSPLFRSFDPVASPQRSVPQIETAWTGNDSARERYASTNRALDWRVTVRDNASGGGATDSDDMRINVTTSSGPFRVTSQPSSTTLEAGTPITVTWDVANTTAAPVSASTVSISFAADGRNFDTLLAIATPNDGSQVVVVPPIAATNGRIRVMGDGNIFFSVNTGAITVDVPAEPASLSFIGGPVTEVEEGVATPVGILLDPGSTSVIPGSALFITRIDDEPAQTDTLSLVAANEYQGVLPPLDCGQTVSYQAVVSTEDGNVITLPDGSFAMASVNCACPADINGDGVITGSDFNAWVSAFGDQDPIADQNGDGQFTGADFNAFIANANDGCP